MIAALACETGIAPSVLLAEDTYWLDLMLAHLKAKADAVSGHDDDIDWDETYGTED